jgi:microcystin-dependent protein
MAWNTPSDWSYKEAPGSTKMNEQVRDNLNYLKNSLPPGVIIPYAGATSPDQWLLCDGSEISRTTYASLFSIIGTLYGIGDGSNTFNLPDIKGKAIVGKNSAETEFDTLGKTGGEKTHTLISDEMPVHTHTQDSHTHGIYTLFGTDSSNRRIVLDTASGHVAGTDLSRGNVDNTTATNQNAGGGSAHNNLQPYIALNYIIKY